MRAWVILGLLVTGCGEDDGELIVQPVVVQSEGGVLHATLTPARQQVRVAGKDVTTGVYNGSFVAPTLWARPGDVLRVDLVNRLDEHTNLHFHGLNVSPEGRGDNIFVHVQPGETHNYEMQLGEDHPVGLFWYHSHAHGLAEEQVFGGLSGGLVIDGLLDPFPELQGITEQVLLLRDIQIDPDGTIPSEIDSSAPTTRLVNGQWRPKLQMQPGETQLWHLGNIGANLYYRLVLDEHVLYEIGRDGNRRTQLIARPEIVLPPSSRVSVLVQADRSGKFALRTLAYSTGPQGDDYPEDTLLKLVVSGEALPARSLPARFPAVEDLRGRPVAHARSFTFSETEDGNTFFIDGKQFDESRIDTRVKLGDLEEWTLINVSGEQHVFHIHQLDFQVTEINGEAQPFIGLQDTVNLPIATDAGPGVVKVLIPFTDPVIVGKFVYHCHILEHEDGGMMATVEVTP